MVIVILCHSVVISVKHIASKKQKQKQKQKEKHIGIKSFGSIGMNAYAHEFSSATDKDKPAIINNSITSRASTINCNCVKNNKNGNDEPIQTRANEVITGFEDDKTANYESTGGMIADVTLLNGGDPDSTNKAFLQEIMNASRLQLKNENDTRFGIYCDTISIDAAPDHHRIECANAEQIKSSLLSSSSSNLNSNSNSTCPAANAQQCIFSQSIPHVAIRFRDDSGEQSDISLETDTDSSTPTTADIADLVVGTCSPFSHLKEKHRAPMQNTKMIELATQGSRLGVNGTAASLGAPLGSNNGSIADDNLSGSIATTTTDVDMDNITVASPNISLNTTRLHSVHPITGYSTQNTTINSPANAAADANDASTSVSAQHQQQHPSAAYLQSDARQCDAIISMSSHKRTLSAASYRSTASQHPSLSAVSVHSVHSRFYNWIRWMCLFFKSSGIGEPSVYHALVVIFLEFFAWGLLTMPVISVLNQTFPDHTFLMNGLVMGIKGILSFLSAPLIGALSDIWGRKFFLLITVFFTCAPIPLMTINSWWFFAMISISGIFAVTFSVVFAYVADVTTVEERSRAYGLVSATFAASLVISPALGAALMEMYSDTLVVALATAIAVLDVFFILVAVPESLPEKVRPSSWGAPISWEQADPFAALRKVGTDHTILMQCVTVLLSYLPEAGQYSCIFVYIKLKMGFNSMEVAIFIAVVGILSISIQVTLGYLMRVLGAKRTIILGLILEMFQLLWYGFGSQKWMMWAAGILAALGSITYPAISAFVSIHSTPDRQGAVQGMVTGMRGLCNGLGPAMFGVIFYLFNVDLNDEQLSSGLHEVQNASLKNEKYSKFIPGPPFMFGAFMVILAILVAIFIPEGRGEIVAINRTPSEKKRISLDVQYEIETGHKATGPLAPLMRSDSLAQL